MNRYYPQVAHRASHRCEYCRAPEVAFNLRFEIEHISPKAQGGNEVDENLALGCRSCNLYKSNDVSGADPVTTELTPLFHPRTDKWSDHFAVEVDQTIRGLTAVGRATVLQLRMNSNHQLAARRQWIRLGLFP